jgi:signal transduction histidine kinase/CheY-like chemotaxis protein
VDEVPAGYLPISSGLGASAPTSLIVLPIVVEDQVLGVIELASLRPFTSVQRDFLEQLRESIGVNVTTIVANARTDELLAESQRLAAELQARSQELQVRQEELQRSNAELEEKAALLVSQNRDIETKNLEIEQARQELEARAQQLALASKYKSEFLANMSHELRTPLNSLLILAQLLAQNPTRDLTPKQVEYAEIIHSAGSDLLQLINDILDLSKVEAGKMDISLERVPLHHLQEYVEATFRPLTAQKSLDFRISAASNAPDEVVTDVSRLRQVLRNLLSNAVKFTDSGSVELRIENADVADLPVSVAAHGPLVAFKVIDTGIGIAEDQIESIFGAFQQADGTTSRKYGGTGLGLSISREIAYLLGGVILAESAPGRGSTFTLYLPITHPDLRTVDPTAPGAVITPTAGAVAQHDQAEPSSASSAPPRRVLVLEERQGGLLSMVAESAVVDERLMGEARGDVQFVTAVSVDEARAFLAAGSCSCVVLQLDMPGQSALRLLDAIEEDPALGGSPILAHSSRQMDSEQERLLSDRTSSQRLKVVRSLDELREGIALHLTAGRPDDLPSPVTHSAQDEVSPGLDDSLSRRVALVVDDDSRNLFALTGILELYGMQVIHADNGRRAIDVLTENPDLDVILMDVMMPEMDGYAATTAIRTMPEHANLPIIMVTAKAMPGDQEKSLAAGANDYVTKPVDAEDLIARIRRCLSVDSRTSAGQGG